MSTLAADASPDVVGRDVLDARCVLLERSVRMSGHVKPEAIDAVRPGGAQNGDTTATGVLYFLCCLHRMHERGPDVASATGSPRWDAHAMEDVRAALHAAPVPLRLTIGGEWAVHPKSEYALHRCALIDLGLVWVAERRLALEEAEQSPLNLDTLSKLVELQARLDGELAWIVTHPGCDVPWSESDGWDPALPSWTRTLDVTDHIAIRRAHLDVNLRRINVIAERTRSMAASGDAMPLPAFLGVMSSELQVRPQELTRRWSLGEVFVQALMKWEATERARAEADRKREQQG